MRVLQLVQKPQRRGAEIFAFQLSAWLRREGHDVRTVYLYAVGGDTLGLTAADVVLDGRERSLLERLPGVHPRLLSQVHKSVETAEPDVVQVNGARTVKYGAAVKRIGRAEWKLCYRNIDSPAFWVRGWARRNFYRHLVMPQLDGVVGVSERTMAEVVEFYRLRVLHEFIPNGVALEAMDLPSDAQLVRSACGTATDATVALFVGHLSRQKRPDRFLRVVAKAVRQRPGVVGWILGNGPDRAALVGLAEELGVAGSVRFLGYRDDVAPVIKSADIYVNTSDTEGIPAVVIECGYAGLPTVGSHVGGMPECVSEGVTGYLVPPGEEGQFVERLLRLVDDGALRARLGGAARERATREFSMNVIGPRYLRFYERLLSGEGSRVEARSGQG